MSDFGNSWCTLYSVICCSSCSFILYMQPAGMSALLIWARLLQIQQTRCKTDLTWAADLIPHCRLANSRKEKLQLLPFSLTIIHNLQYTGKIACSRNVRGYFPFQLNSFRSHKSHELTHLCTLLDERIKQPAVCVFSCVYRLNRDLLYVGWVKESSGNISSALYNHSVKI